MCKFQDPSPKRQGILCQSVVIFKLNSEYALFLWISSSVLPGIDLHVYKCNIDDPLAIFQNWTFKTPRAGVIVLGRHIHVLRRRAIMQLSPAIRDFYLIWAECLSEVFWSFVLRLCVNILYSHPLQNQWADYNQPCHKLLLRSEFCVFKEANLKKAKIKWRQLEIQSFL